MTGSRSYSSATREAQSAATRARIVDAAGRLFIRDGFAATPIRAIASLAGVSVQSVSLAGPKASLLIAAFERSFAGDEGGHKLSDRPAMAEILAEPDTSRLIDRYVSFIAAANERSAGIVVAMRAAADADPAARVAASELEGRRRAEMSDGAALLVARGLVDPDDAPAAADVLGFLTEPHSFVYFVVESGWSRPQYEAWLGSSIRRLVVAPGALSRESAGAAGVATPDGED